MPHVGKYDCSVIGDTVEDREFRGRAMDRNTIETSFWMLWIMVGQATSQQRGISYYLAYSSK